MPVIGESPRLQSTVRQDGSNARQTEPQSEAKAMDVVEIRKVSTSSGVDSSGSGLLRLDQQTLILVVAGFAAALSLMARLR